MSNTIKNERRRAFKKREQIMRAAIMQALGMLAHIPDESGKIAEVGGMLADALAKESSVQIPDSRPAEVIEAEMNAKNAARNNKPEAQ